MNCPRCAFAMEAKTKPDSCTNCGFQFPRETGADVVIIGEETEASWR